jgi:acyl carrier protein
MASDFGRLVTEMAVKAHGGDGTDRGSRGRVAGARDVSIRSEVVTQFEQVAKEQDKPLAPLVDDLSLLDSGLDSLCLAIIVARLEDVLGIDPFSMAEDAGFPVTFGAFIKFYENAAE